VEQAVSSSNRATHENNNCIDIRYHNGSIKKSPEETLRTFNIK